MMRRTTAILSLVLAVCVTWVTGCTDPVVPAPAGLAVFPGLIMSELVQSPNPVTTSAQTSAVSPINVGVVYLSLPPTSVPGGLRATIRNLATNQSLTVFVVNGGFDPVAIAASVGDTLLIEVARNGYQSLGGVELVTTARRRPVIVRTSPPSGGRDVPLNVSPLIVFSTPIDSTTLATGAVQLWRGTTLVAGTARLTDDTGIRAEFRPDTLLAGETEYRLVVSPGIRDVNGGTLDSTITIPFTTGATAPATNLVFASVSVGFRHSCGLTTTGAAYCWGDNDVGTLGDGTTTSSTTPLPVAGGLTFATLSAGLLHTCGVTTSGAAYCWGTGGIGFVGYSPTPALVTDRLTFATVSAGAYHSCGVTTVGSAYCWGDGYYGQLGDGTTTPGDDRNPGYAPNPVPLAGGLTFMAVIAGGNHSCGVTTTGTTYCWGLNMTGQLGVGTSTGPERCVNGDTIACSTIPVPVAGGVAFKTVIAGIGITCGLTTGGAPYCWGDNTYGHLGNDPSTGPEWCGELPPDPWGVGGGAVPCSRVPIAVAGGLNLASLTAGGYDACGLTPTGAAYCWGNSLEGGGPPTPVEGAGGLSFATLSAGGSTTCGVTTAGVAYCWGANDRGQLGDGTTTPSSRVPVKVAGQP